MTEHVAVPAGTVPTPPPGAVQAPVPPQVPQPPVAAPAVPPAPTAPAAPSAAPSAPEGTVDDILARGKGAETPNQVEAKAEAERPQGGLNSIDPDSLEDPQLRAYANLILATVPNLDVDRAIGKALEYGDPGLIDRAYVREIGGDKAEVLQTALDNMLDLAQAYSTALQTAVHTTAGGKANWDSAVGVFNQKAPDHLRQVAIKLLNSHVKADVENGAKFVLDYAKTLGATIQPAHTVTAVGGGVAPSAERGLTRDEYKSAISQLDRNGRDWQAKEAELTRLRKVGRDRGL